MISPARPTPPRRSWLRRLLRVTLVALVALLGLLVARGLYVFRDRNPGYALDLRLDPTGTTPESRRLEVGFSRVKINPDLSDPARPVWLAGFSQHRAATAIHDDLWAVAAVIADGQHRIGLVALDAIGFFHDDVIEVRRRLPPEARVDYTIVCSTHNHSTPDLMGLWGPDPLHTGVDPRYREQVIAACVQALAGAANALQPALLASHEIPVPPAGLVTDTRRPEVYDPDVRILQFLRPDDSSTIGSVVGWANHPETPWARNTEITADFCGYLRAALEHGVVVNGQTLAPGVGGIHLYVNGAVGGLITTPPKVTVHDPYLEQDFTSPSHDKARAVAHQLASRILPHLSATNLPATNQAPISVRARTIELPLDNLAFLAAPMLGLLDRGHSHWKHLRTEVAVVRVGQATLACIPGEIYPELVNGGIERAPGADFDVDPVEIPPLRDFLPGKLKLILGLANDEIGYIIPKSEWDRKPPYLYGSKGVYGEINSVGPETAPLLHRALRDLTQR